MDADTYSIVDVIVANKIGEHQLPPAAASIPMEVGLFEETTSNRGSFSKVNLQELETQGIHPIFLLIPFVLPI